MSKRYKSDANGEGMLKEAWSWVKDTEAAHNVSITVSMSPTKRIGVWNVEMRVEGAGVDRKGGVLARTVREWPNSLQQSYAGAFFDQVMATCRFMDEVALDAVGVTRGTPQES